MIKKFKIWLAQRLRKFCEKYDPYYDYAKQISMFEVGQRYLPSRICAIKEIPINDWLHRKNKTSTNLWTDEESIKKDLAQELAKTLVEGKYLEFERLDEPKQNKIIFYATLYCARKG